MTESLFFLGILPPPAIQSEVTEIKEWMATEYNSRHALKSPPHITLFPPFWFDEGKLSLLHATLMKFTSTMDRMHVVLDGFDCFKPRVIFIDVVKSTELENLQTNLKTAMKEQWNLDGDGRPVYHPHMTIAFKDLSKRAFYLAWEHFRNLTFEASFPVDEVVLLKHQQRIWNIESTFSLRTRVDQI